MNYSIIRCICALVIGVLLVAWPEAAILYLVITIGVLFLVPGLFSLSGYLIRGKQDGSRFPIAGLGSLLFGCKRLRDSILSPIFHSYIFAMYKNESLWI